MKARRLSREALAAAAYLEHLEHCDRGCRPVVANRSRDSFVPGTGQGCPRGLRLAEAWQAEQERSR